VHAEFHVVPDGGRWKVKYEGRALSDHQTQAQAIRAARGQANQMSPSQVIVHGGDDQLQDESSYRRDPYAPPNDN
jgi:acetylglutamate kinase